MCQLLLPKEKETWGLLNSKKLGEETCEHHIGTHSSDKDVRRQQIQKNSPRISLSTIIILGTPLVWLMDWGEGKSAIIVGLFMEALLATSTELHIPTNVPNHQAEQEQTRETKERVGKKMPNGLYVDGAPGAKPVAQHLVHSRGPHTRLPS